MTLELGWARIALGGMVVAAAAGVAASGQSAKTVSGRESYIIKLKLPAVDTAGEVAIRKHNVVPAAVYWDNLYNGGTVSLLGSAQKGDATYRVVIVEGVNGEQARRIANSDPNVKAGAVTAEVIPLHVDLAKK